MKYIIKIKTPEKKDIAEIVKDGDTTKFVYKDIIIQTEDVFPFRALYQIRSKLEPQGITLLINGSRKDVFPTGMHLNSDYCDILVEGYLPQSENKINIYENIADENLIGSIHDQYQYHLCWIDSIKNFNS